MPRFRLTQKTAVYESCVIEAEDRDDVKEQFDADAHFDWEQDHHPGDPELVAVAELNDEEDAVATHLVENDEFLDKTDRVQAAMDSFWATVARHHPSVKSGDFPPDADSQFRTACADAIRIWLLNIAPMSWCELCTCYHHESSPHIK